MFYKRPFKLLAILTLCFIFFVGCNPIPNKNTRKVLSGFSVHYIDVGQGDCIFVQFPDEKTLVIDSGRDINDNSKTIIQFLSTYSVNKIDYFVLTHPDVDHVGNAKTIIETFEIGKIYHPYIMDEMLDFSPEYKTTIELAKEKQIELEVSDCYDYIKGENYQLIFLSPTPLRASDSAYKDYLTTSKPPETEENNLSPIIYLEYLGVRFLFTGDAGEKQESVALSNALLLISHYNTFELSVNLSEIDFLKVSHHGSNDSTSEKFLQTIQPKNAIISVGGDNYYGHPTSEVLQRLLDHSPNYTLYRTDVNGTISVGVNELGLIEVVIDN